MVYLHYRGILLHLKIFSIQNTYPLTTTYPIGGITMQNTQLSIYDFPMNEPNNIPDNIISFPVKQSKPKHTQQRVSPIKDPDKVNQIFNTLLSSGRYGLRNATIFALQLAIGRRTNDMLHMTISAVYDFKRNCVKNKITVDEHKTGKTARDLPLPKKTTQLLSNYIQTLKNKSPEALLFPSQKKNRDGSQRPLNTASLDYIYQTYTSQLFSSEDEITHISSYAARKTYGHNIYTECMKNHNGFLPGTDINALQYVQSVFNHESSTITLRYIGAYDTPASDLAEDIANKYEF